MEAAKDDYRIHCEELEKQLIELQHRNDDLTSLAEESQALRDELDVMRFVQWQMVGGVVFSGKALFFNIGCKTPTKKTFTTSLLGYRDNYCFCLFACLFDLSEQNWS